MNKNSVHRAAPPSVRPVEDGAPQAVQRAVQGSPLAVSKGRFAAVMQAAEESGLLGERSGRIASRVSPALVAQAKRLSGIESDSDLIAFALASVALEDQFAQAFKESRGTVDPDLKLGF